MANTRGQRYRQALLFKQVMKEYDDLTGTGVISRPVEVSIYLRMLVDTEEEREALIWAVFGR